MNHRGTKRKPHDARLNHQDAKITKTTEKTNLLVVVFVTFVPLWLILVSLPWPWWF